MYIYCSEATVSGERDACHIAVTTRFVHIRLAPLAIIHFLSIFTRMREMIHMVRTVLLYIRFIASSRYWNSSIMLALLCFPHNINNTVLLLWEGEKRIDKERARELQMSLNFWNDFTQEFVIHVVAMTCVLCYSVDFFFAFQLSTFN